MYWFLLNIKRWLYPPLHWPPIPNSGKEIFLSLRFPDSFLGHSLFSQCLPALFHWRQSGWSVKLITNLHVMLKSRISGAKPPSPLWLHGLHRDKFMFFTTLHGGIHNRAAEYFMWFRNWNFVYNLFEICTSIVQRSFECGCWMSRENLGTGFNRGCWKTSPSLAPYLPQTRYVFRLYSHNQRSAVERCGQVCHVLM
jgi:hypothetical protein